MNQLALPLKARNGNASSHHPSGHKQFSNDLRKLIGDLQAAEDLRADQLKRLQSLRAGVYTEAARLGVKPQVLRAVLSLQKTSNTKSRGSSS